MNGSNHPPGPPQPLGQVPLLGRQQTKQQQKQQVEAGIQQAVHQLAIGIYSHVATSHIATRDDHQAVDRTRLQHLAKDALIAAQAYFEGLGMATFGPPSGQ